MDDDDLLDRIETLTREERGLRLAAGPAGLSAPEHERLAEVARELEVLYDLRDRRRATAAAGGDPSQVGPRDADTVEGYLQ